MSISMHRATVPVFVRALGVLAAELKKAEDHAREAGVDPGTLLEARLTPDMLSLTAQVQRASDTSKASAERLSGVPSPKMPDEEASFADLQARIAKTVTYLESVPAEAFEGSEARQLELSFGPVKMSFRGDDYLLRFALPNFFFHVVTAHDILRQQGVAVGKRDFLGSNT